MIRIEQLFPQNKNETRYNFEFLAGVYKSECTNNANELSKCQIKKSKINDDYSCSYKDNDTPIVQPVQEQPINTNSTICSDDNDSFVIQDNSPQTINVNMAQEGELFEEENDSNVSLFNLNNRNEYIFNGDKTCDKNINESYYDFHNNNTQNYVTKYMATYVAEKNIINKKHAQMIRSKRKHKFKHSNTKFK